MVTSDDVGSEFVLESLLMRVQALTTKQPSQEQAIQKYLRSQLAKNANKPGEGLNAS